MPIAAGARLGVYEIVALIGAGGMGEVYRARDRALNRDVAIKILPEAFAGDGDRIARFKREAQVLASLNHPHIAAIYGLEESPSTGSRQGPVTALVLELVDGPTLADRIAEGPIPIDEALPIARQIAEALEAAHEHGIVHRDLKPANIKLTADGNVKVLDFGLAKAMDAVDGVRSQVDMSLSPTITSPAMATHAGVILGTAAYMSPEQAKAKPVDKRTDIWAFGCVLYEMLTGKRAFEGEDVSDTLAAILRGEPDWNALPPEAPVALKTLLLRCLEKDRRRRVGDTAAVLFVLNEPALIAPKEKVVSAVTAGPRPAYSRLAWTIAALAVLALSIVTVRHLREAPAALDAIQFTIPPPENASFATLPGGGTGITAQMAVAPDGQYVVFVANTQNEYQLWIRRLGSVTAQLIPGTENGSFPFWSPDSRYIGFFANGKLKKVPVAGGPPGVLCDAPSGRGGTWNRDNVIVFAPAPAGALQRVSGDGGVPRAASALDKAYGEGGHRFPSFLPDGRHFVYSGITGTCCPAAKPGRIRIGTLDTLDASTLLQADSSAAFASGHLLFYREGTLMAQPFDATLRQFAGDPFPIAEQIGHEGSRYASFSASDTGVLVFAGGLARPTTRLTWMDRAGRALSTIGDAAAYQSLAMSSDERLLAVVLSSGNPENRDIWIVDIMRGTPTRFTFDAGEDIAPVWAPDNTRVVFQSLRQGIRTLRQKRVDGTTNEEVLPSAVLGVGGPTDWAADGRHVAFGGASQGAGALTDIWALPLFGERKPFPLVNTPFLERQATFSPDGRWFAYQSIESGQWQIYVQPFPPTGGKFQVSKDGGTLAAWRRDGKELFFLSSDSRMMAAPVDTAGQFQHGVPTPLFTVPAAENNAAGVIGKQYAVTKDGQRFLVNAIQQQSKAIPLTVVVNWLAAVQK